MENPLWLLCPLVYWTIQLMINISYRVMKRNKIIRKGFKCVSGTWQHVWHLVSRCALYWHRERVHCATCRPVMPRPLHQQQRTELSADLLLYCLLINRPINFFFAGYCYEFSDHLSLLKEFQDRKQSLR